MAEITCFTDVPVQMMWLNNSKDVIVENSTQELVLDLIIRAALNNTEYTCVAITSNDIMILRNITITTTGILNSFIEFKKMLIFLLSSP